MKILMMNLTLQKHNFSTSYEIDHCMLFKCYISKLYLLLLLLYIRLIHNKDSGVESYSRHAHEVVDPGRYNNGQLNYHSHIRHSENNDNTLCAEPLIQEF